MKKLIYLFVACCICSVASAQKVSEKDLQGSWKLAAFNASGIYLDLATGLVTVSEELKSQLTPDIMEQINEGMKQATEQLKNSTTVFSGNTVEQKIGGKEKKGTYTLKDEAGMQTLTATWGDATTSEMVVFVKDNQLHLSKSEQGQSAELIFNKG